MMMQIKYKQYNTRNDNESIEFVPNVFEYFAVHAEFNSDPNEEITPN